MIRRALGLSLGFGTALCVGCFASGGSDREVGGEAGTGDGGTVVGEDGSVPAGKSVFYVHTEATLYEIDPEDKSLALKKLGDVDCMKTSDPKADHSLTDLAVSRDNRIFAVSSNFAYSLELQSGIVHCAKTWPINKAVGDSVFYGLTFAPIGTLSPTDEVLVAANNDGQMYTIDESTGKTTQVGTFGVDSKTKLPWSLSGDIVFLENNGTPVGFATVRTCPSGGGACSGTDTLIELDVKAIKPGTASALKAVRGPLNKGSWCTSKSSTTTFDKMFGIVAYQDRVYGFSDEGYIVEISNKDGSSCLITANVGMNFKGAGIATSAPVVVVPN